MPALPDIHIAMFCSDAQFVPGAATLYTLERYIGRERGCKLHILSTKLGKEQRAWFSSRNNGVQVDIKPCAAADSGGVLQSLPKLLPDVERVLLVEAGSLFCKEPGSLFDTSLKNAPAAAMRSLSKEGRFDQSFMLVSLNTLRKLPPEKAEKGIVPLPGCCAPDASRLWGDGGKPQFLFRLNQSCHTHFQNEKELLENAVLLRFPVAPRPWETDEAPFASRFIQACREALPPALCPYPASAPHEEPCMVSIVMPCYNSADYLPQTLDAMFAQTWQDFELICCDDESTDETLSILKRYEAVHPNMRVFSGVKQDAGFQRNRGTDAARGKYVYYMDSDDLLDEDALEVLVDEAERMQADVVYFEGDTFYDNKELEKDFGKCGIMYGRSHIYPCLMDGRDFFARAKPRVEFPVQPCMKLTRLGMLREKGIRFSEVCQMNDALQSLKTVMAARRCTVLPAVMYHRRVHDNSLVTNKQYKNPQRMIESRSVAWVGCCLLAMENRDHEAAHAALAHYCQYIKRELDWATSKVEDRPDFAFLDKHYSGSQVMSAAHEWELVQNGFLSRLSRRINDLRENLKSSPQYKAFYKIKKKLPLFH